jgi:TusA-related sulfurtransferase
VKERENMKLETGDLIEVTFDDPALTGQSIKAILIGKDKSCYAIHTLEHTIALIVEQNIKKNFGSTIKSKEKAISLIENWKGSYKPKII